MIAANQGARTGTTVKLLLAMVASAVPIMIGLMNPPQSCAQEQAASTDVTFEVASVKPHDLPCPSRLWSRTSWTTKGSEADSFYGMCLCLSC